MAKKVEKGDIVVPGQELYEGEEFTAGDGAFESGGTIRSRFLGAADFRSEDSVQVIPRYNPYVPSQGDLVIGEVERVGPSNWNVDIGCPWSAFMHVNAAVDEYVDHDDDISQWYGIGDVIVAKVKGVTEGMDVKLSMEHENARELEGGRVISVAPAKVPRIIGSKGTMVEMIKDATDTMIVIGQNGRVWIDGTGESLAVEAIRKVADEAHTDNLTEKMEEWLEENGGDI
ncbi:MAG: exosome complex RNA-binding protein Rrp4 [Candidatus Nanohaloarchaeota archaeon QJJ-7]|nr:exosome complex RNA-binding protein Rrp4 [Candidatus Nanohaloarchaeota archaeon QJJ-7]